MPNHAISMEKCNRLVAIGAIFFGILILYLARDLGSFDEQGVPGENYWPSSIAWLFIFLGSLQALQFFKKPAGKSVDLSSQPVRMAYLAALLALVYGVALLCVGFFIATLLFVPAMMLLMGERRKWVLFLVGVAVVGTIYVFFALVFNTTLPTSVFFD